ncbi:hypothetical protein [Ferrimonas marina]|uniref:Uncharacterized protein n=1 Tax=Ferrimonas marina TaxID=299255 RepID=A0A1M5TKM8_9GAMM|nr:hypothetical protein [Ferrimonas marina]SHH51365.1 hypothetical protein SAMN02745129_2185 [Ferrimonas marina]
MAKTLTPTRLAAAVALSPMPEDRKSALLAMLNNTTQFVGQQLAEFEASNGVLLRNDPQTDVGIPCAKFICTTPSAAPEYIGNFDPANPWNDAADDQWLRKLQDKAQTPAPTAADKPSYVTSSRTPFVQIYAPKWYKNEGFLAALNNPGNGLARCHTPGPKPNEGSDVYVKVDGSLNGDGDASDILPTPIWQAIIEACRAQYPAGAPGQEILVQIFNTE